MAKRTHYKKPSNALIIKAFKYNLGLQSNTADYLKVDRSTLVRWINEDPELSVALDETELRNIDFTQENLHKRIKGFTQVTTTKVTRSDGKVETTEKETYYPPSSTDIQFHLSRRARHHGYSTSLDIEHKVIHELSTEQIEAKLLEVTKRLGIDYKTNEDE